MEPLGGESLGASNGYLWYQTAVVRWHQLQYQIRGGPALYVVHSSEEDVQGIFLCVAFTG